MASGGSNSSLPVLKDYKEDISRLFSVVHGGKVRDSRHSFKPERFRLVTKKNLFPTRKAQQWSRLPREVMEAPLLEIFKSQLQ